MGILAYELTTKQELILTYWSSLDGLNLTQAQKIELIYSAYDREIDSYEIDNIVDFLFENLLIN